MNLPALCMVVLVSMTKDAYEDYKRLQNDNKENNTECKLLSGRDRKTAPFKWKDIRCGWIVKVEEDQVVPADMVLLWSSG